MLKISEVNILHTTLLMRLTPFIKRAVKTMAFLKSICVPSEDTLYKWHFIRHYMPEIYKRHTSELYMNCIFCSHLVRAGCHKHCLKCSIGAYIHCSPLLPGIIYCENSYIYNNDPLTVPWFYKKPCGSFNRLPPANYFKNLYVPLSPIGIYNFEIFEGLEQGLSGGERPCHVCASIDYELYKNCTGQGDFDMHSPCHKITEKLSSLYQNQEVF